MKKLNNKGFTVVELTLSFLFVFTLAFSMYELLFNYRTKQNEEAIKAQLIDYSNQVVLAIQNDISERTLKNIEYCTAAGAVIDKCLILNFNDSTSKQLSVEKRNVEYDGDLYPINYINYGGIYYESDDAILLDFRPNYMLYNTYEKDNLEDDNVNVYKISIPIYHNDLDGNYGVEVIAVGYDYVEPIIREPESPIIPPEGGGGEPETPVVPEPETPPETPEPKPETPKEDKVETGVACERTGDSICLFTTGIYTAENFSSEFANNTFDFDVTVWFIQSKIQWNCYTGSNQGFKWFGSDLYGGYRCWQGSQCYDILKSKQSSNSKIKSCSDILPY